MDELTVPPFDLYKSCSSTYIVIVGDLAEYIPALAKISTSFSAPSHLPAIIETRYSPREFVKATPNCF